MIQVSTWPIIERELRVVLLRKGAHRHWMTTARRAGVMTLVLLIAEGLFGRRSFGGNLLFNFLFAGGCYTVIHRGLQITSDLFSEERRNGTLGLLILTGLRPLEIFISKLGGVALTTLYQAASGLPFLGVAFVMGGVQFDQFAGATVYLLVMLALITALGTLGSVLFRDSGLAQLAAIVAFVFLAGIPWIVHAVNVRPVAQPGFPWRVLSPAFGAVEIFQSFPSGTPAFWRSLAWMLVYALAAGALGALVLQSTWREASPWNALGRREWWQRWLVNRPGAVRRLRQELDRGNPFCWLAARQAAPSVVAGWLIGAVLVLWVGIYACLGQRWLNTGGFVVTSMVMHVVLNLTLAYAAARTMAQERQDGGLELLLTTPLTVREMVEGQHRAILMRFGRVFIAVFTLDAILCSAGSLLVRRWDLSTVLSYASLWILLTVFWCGVHRKTVFRSMWIGLWSGRTAYAAWQGGAPVPWPFLVLLALICSTWMRYFPVGAFAELFIMSIVLTLAILGAFGMAARYREKLLEEIPDIACSPVPRPDDRQFAGWDPDKIHPVEQWRNWVSARRTMRRRVTGRAAK